MIIRGDMHFRLEASSTPVVLVRIIVVVDGICPHWVWYVVSSYMYNIVSSHRVGPESGSPSDVGSSYEAARRMGR